MPAASAPSSTRIRSHRGVEAVAHRPFDAGVLDFAPRLRSFIRRRVSNDAVADDLTQETLLKVYRAREGLRDGARLEAWLFQIARGTIIDHYRRRRPQEELPVALAAESADELAAMRARVIVSMRHFLGGLPPTYREPVRLAELEGLPLARIALRLDLSLTAVKSRVRRGRALLKKKLQGCCRFEFDRLGRMIGFERRQQLCCDDCDGGK
jgi:RNA polymerase sigma-70 factor (ECF subfamily)